MSKMEQPNTIKVFLAVCSHRSIDVSSKLSMDGLITAVPKGFRLTTVVGLEASIAKSRSTWATIFHRGTDNDILAFIDDDVAFTPADFWKICKHAYEEQQIVGGVYMKRELPPIAIVKTPDGKFNFDGEIQEVEGLGCGFIAIPRAAVDAVAKDCILTHCGKFHDGKELLIYYPMFAEIVVDQKDNEGYWLGEDYGFCYLAREKGFKVLADTSIFLKHIGVYAYSPNDLMIKREV